MAFVNAYLTEEEKKKFEEAKVRDPRYKLAKEYLTPSIWTVDRENNIALINCGVADRDEHNKETFALIYKQLDNEHLINCVLIQKYTEDREMLKKQFGVGLVTKWKVFSCDIPNILKKEITNKEIYDVLANALSVYGVNGSPKYELSVKAILDIEKEKYNES